jgi:hypothetical protein
MCFIPSSGETLLARGWCLLQCCNWLLLEINQLKRCEMHQPRARNVAPDEGITLYCT